MQLLLTEYKWFRALSFIFLFVVVALFAYTGKYILLVAPFVFLFLLLAGLNWKVAYWILIFTIPISMEIELLPGSLSTSLPDEPIMWLFLILTALLWAHRPSILPEWWWRNTIVLVVVLQLLWTIVSVAFSTELFCHSNFFFPSYGW